MYGTILIIVDSALGPTVIDTVVASENRLCHSSIMIAGK